MAKNRKTVFKHFSYLQCDDFAAYLSNMAAQGWHFMEWRVGLVFQRGEPEDSVYAVEVFPLGSQHAMCPDERTLDFADYCKAAGWSLVDSRQKICIFKRTRDDATPIVPPKERLKNACNVYHKQLLGQLLTFLIFAISMTTRLLNASQLINSIFNNFVLVTYALFAFILLFTCAKYIGFWCWKQRAEKQCYRGQRNVLQNTGEKTWNIIQLSIVIPIILCYVLILGPWGNLIFLCSGVAIILLAVFISWFRLDKETHVGITVLLSVLLILTISFLIFLLPSDNDEQNKYQTVPLHYYDLGVDAGTVTSSHGYEDISLLGSRMQYFIHYNDASLSYIIYETKHNWILDVIWDDNISKENTINGSVADCTAMWDAQEAFYNGRDYYVRYDDQILILRFLPFELTEEHVTIIRRKLGMEG